MSLETEAWPTEAWNKIEARGEGDRLLGTIVKENNQFIITMKGKGPNAQEHLLATSEGEIKAMFPEALKWKVVE